jgi:opine dehydrogenase
MKVAVLGAGHGGHAMAADLTIAGHEVRLAAIPDHSHGLIAVGALGGIFLDGVTSSGKSPGFAKFSMVTTNIADAVRNCEVIMLVLPAFAQDAYMDELAECVEKGQIIVFNPGKFGALEFHNRLKKLGRENDVIVGETVTLIYAAKDQGIDHVRIKSVKTCLQFSAIPAFKTLEALEKLKQLFACFVPSQNIFETSLDDPGMVIHPISTLMNTSRIEEMGPYRTAHYDITPSISRVIEEVDKDRTRICQALGVHSMTLLEASQKMYGTGGNCLYDSIMQIKAHNVQMAPDSLNHRYITEEIPYSLVPLSSLGNMLGVKTPAVDTIIELASMAMGIDYRKMGRTVETLQLSGLDREGLIEYVS